jgi:hypothetical protein
VRSVQKGGVAIALSLALTPVGVSLVEAQQRIPGWDRVAGPGEHQYNVQLLRPSGGPVVPIFDGWYVNPDGTKELCFGYFNVNTEQAIELPLGPSNYIEPAEFDGVQPTRFLPVGGTPDAGRRYWCVFTVQVPADYGDRDVIWRLTVDGREFSVPGRTRFTPYQLQGESAADLRTVSPQLRLDPDGPDIFGPDGDHVMTGPFSARVGEPIGISAWARRDNPYGMPIIEGFTPPGSGEDTRPIRFTWFKHRGPGEVTFDERIVELQPDSWEWAPDAMGEVTVEATFDEPGDYVIRVLTHNLPTSFTHFCCWTNGYVSVRVTE